ncbi:cell division protein ZapE [Agrilutibacter solisilvae]|uniref:AFG1 family ATPase n=1 Tax=Agrilutibacter solisilvae TaxID=2763317 RepID=A0A974Y0L5_9GAMM|nr:cell division protein ZapE [Lysobacter solisilvae]QSX79212.1 AFG1 family ATPase [Lysobacter solisilvae]
MNDASATRPSRRYAQGVAQGRWEEDPAQQAALVQLDRIHDALAEPVPQGWLKSLLGRTPPAPQGLYLWGGVGRGKTFLIDLFFDGLPLPDVGLPGAPADRPGKRRTHFHRFMREVHARLRAHAGERDPLALIAAEWQRTLRVLVLDEFFVNDIGDAMLLARLLERLFAGGVVLVTSSNTAPVNLYKDGLQREAFLPAIAQIQAHTQVVLLDSPRDYRLRALTRSPVYRAPLDDQSDAWLAQRWQELTAGAPPDPGATASGTLSIEGRQIPVRATAEGHAWFDFAALCEGPRAASDYIEIATEHHTLLLGGIPPLGDHNADPARRFVHLIDELYDRHVNLVCTAAAPPPQLYQGTRLGAAFERTASRLIEMQSAEYLALEHRG